MLDEVSITPKERELMRIIRANESEAFPERLAQLTDKTASTVSEKISNLQDKQMVEEAGQRSSCQFYRLTRRGHETVIRLMRTETGEGIIKLRMHKGIVKFQIVSGYEELAKQEVDGTIELNFNSQLLGEASVPEYGKLRYRVTTRHLIVNIPEMVYPPTEEGVWKAYTEAVDAASKVKDFLEGKYQAVRFGRGEPVFSDSHFAIENHPWATTLGFLGFSGIVSSTKLFTLRVDRSKGNLEVDVEGPDTHSYAENLVNNLDYQARNDLKMENEKLRNRISILETFSPVFIPS